MLLSLERRISLVVAGLDPAIHALFARFVKKTWMPGTRPGMTAKA
jgi:hypothetical protein